MTNPKTPTQESETPKHRLLRNGSKSGLENLREAMELAIEQHERELNSGIMSKVHYLDRIFRYVVVIAYSLFCLFYFWLYTV